MIPLSWITHNISNKLSSIRSHVVQFQKIKKKTTNWYVVLTLTRSYSTNKNDQIKLVLKILNQIKKKTEKLSWHFFFDKNKKQMNNYT